MCKIATGQSWLSFVGLLQMWELNINDGIATGTIDQRRFSKAVIVPRVAFRVIGFANLTTGSKKWDIEDANRGYRSYFQTMVPVKVHCTLK